MCNVAVRYQESAEFRDLFNAAARNLRSAGGCAAMSERNPEQVTRLQNIGLEIRTPMQILTARELRDALGKDRLPRHMRSIPTLEIEKMPSNMKDIMKGDDGSGTGEPRTETVPLSILQISLSPFILSFWFTIAYQLCHRRCCKCTLASVQCGCWLVWLDRVVIVSFALSCRSIASGMPTG